MNDLEEYTTARLNHNRLELLHTIMDDSANLQARKDLIAVNAELSRRDTGPRRAVPIVPLALRFRNALSRYRGLVG